MLGVVATLLALRDAYDSARDADRRAASLAATQLRGALELTVAAVRGADTLAVDGDVTTAEFAAFADSVIRDSLYVALAYAEVVDADERDAFVSRTGVAITDTDGAGGFVPAPERPQSLVIVEAYPLDPTTRQLIGFDLAGESIRKRATDAAAGSPTPVLSDRTSTATDAVAGLSVVQAVRAPDDTVVGFVTSGIAVDQIIETAGVDSTAADFGLWMDDELLTPNAPTAGASQTFIVADREFEVRTRSGANASLILPLFIALGTVVLAGVVGFAMARDRRRQDQLARLALRNRGIAGLGQRLAGAGDTASLLSEVAARTGPILDDAIVVVARRSPTDAGSVQIDDTSIDLLDRAVERLADGPISHTLATREPTLIAKLDDGPIASIESIVCVPLRLSGGEVFGALLLGWPMAMSSTELDERAVAATTIAELIGAAYERSVGAEVVRVGAERLSEFARALAAAHGSADVRAAVTKFVPDIVGARSADIDLDLDPDGDRDRDLDPDPDVDLDHPDAHPAIRRIILDGSNEQVAMLRVTWRPHEPVGVVQHAVLITLTDLIGQTLSRTARSQREHDVVVQLQRDLLSPPVEISRLEVAVGYQPALGVVGLGGDFYDLVVSDAGRVFAVIGDITGHGSRAVAAMSELKSVMQHLLRSGASIELVCAQADLLLLRRDMYATMQICEIDVDDHTLRYVNAGHPYPVIRRADGATTTLRSGHRPLLGLPESGTIVNEVASTPFGDGDVLLLYTDGLIERRDQPIDEAIDGLVDLVRELGAGTIAGLVGELQERLHPLGERSDDDVALLALRHLGPPAQR